MEMITMQQSWSGRFKKKTAKNVLEFTSSITFDKRLYRYDIEGSLAHLDMLARVGVIKKSEAQKISRGLNEILKEIEKGNFEIKKSDEDIHMAIEGRLIEKIGELGGKLHTARSRNDQIVLDMKLFLRHEIKQILKLLIQLKETIVKKAEENLDAIMPGYTHLQPAQPVLFSHHLMAYYSMLERDAGRFYGCLKKLDRLPLGSGALAGVTFPVDRNYLAKKLSFSEITDNSMDAVSDRDFLLEFLSSSSILMMHLSRFCEDIILWNCLEFNFIAIDESYATGSSIMPQKKNPDVAELIRGKTGRIFGHLLGLLTTLKGLPLAYMRDMQEDKEGVFDTVDTLKQILPIFAGLIETMRINKEKMSEATQKGFLAATDIADYLAGKGIPYRQAHKIVGKIVKDCEKKSRQFEDLTLEEWKKYSPLFKEDIFDFIRIEKCIERRNIIGGTARKQIKKQIEKAKKNIISESSK